MKRNSTGLLAILLLGGMSLCGATWIESGDAGRELLSAQGTGGTGATLDSIFGNLTDVDPFAAALDVDLYQIRIIDPMNFRAYTVGAPGLNVGDPQLFLFDANGLGVYMNDDDESGLNGSQSELPMGHAFGPVLAGIYYLGIGWWDNEPFSASGLIFSSVNFFGTNGPDGGAGGGDPLVGWDDNVLQRIDIETAYEIRLEGAALTVPEPGSFLAVLLGGIAVFMARGRRRQ